MSGLVDRLYIHAKVHALHGYLLDRKDYEKIVHAGNIHASFPGVISEKEASDIISTKEKIFRDQITPFIVLAGLNDRYRDFFRAFLMLFELGNIKQVVTKAYDRILPFSQWNDISPYHSVDVSVRKNDIPLHGLKTLFAGTVFAEAFNFEEPPSYEELESRIDLIAIKNLLRLSEKIQQSNLSTFNDIMITRVLCLKHLWDARIQANYGKAGDFHGFDLMDVFNGTGITIKDINPVEDDMRKRIRSATKEPENRDRKPDVPALEQLLGHYFYAKIKKNFFSDFHSIGPVVSYAWLLYYQVRNLFTIIEGMHLGVSPEIIMQHVLTGA